MSELVVLNLILLGLTTLASYLLARRTLRPIGRAHEQQKRFTADVSHELRTPLTSIRMESEVAMLEPKPSIQHLQATLASNLEEVSRMEVLINNLLMLATVEAGKLRADFTAINLDEMLDTARDTASSQAAARGITIDHEHITKPSVIYGDRPSLTQLAIILLENAIKYSPEGTTVEVAVLQGRGRSGFRISDQGSGISSEALPHIFDRFYRADSSRTGSSGFGLGLSLAKLIADLHNAEIVVSSAEGQGTVVEVKFG